MKPVKLIVREFGWDTTEDDLRAIFAEVTEVESVTRPVDHVSGLPQDYAIVEVPTHANALEAVHRLHGHVVNSHRLRVKIAEEHEMGEDGLLLRGDGEAPEPHVSETTPHKPERYLGRSTRPRGYR